MCARNEVPTLNACWFVSYHFRTCGAGFSTSISAKLSWVIYGLSSQYMNGLEVDFGSQLLVFCNLRFYKEGECFPLQPFFKIFRISSYHYIAY